MSYLGEVHLVSLNSVCNSICFEFHVFRIWVLGIRNAVPLRSRVTRRLGNVFGVAGHTLLPPYP